MGEGEGRGGLMKLADLATVRIVLPARRAPEAAWWMVLKTQIKILRFPIGVLLVLGLLRLFPVLPIPKDVSYFFFPVLGVLLSALGAAHLFGSEYSEGSSGYLSTRPISRRAIFRIKLILLISLCFLSALASTSFAELYGIRKPYIRLWELGVLFSAYLHAALWCAIPAVLFRDTLRGILVGIPVTVGSVWWAATSFIHTIDQPKWGIVLSELEIDMIGYSLLLTLLLSIAALSIAYSSTEARRFQWTRTASTACALVSVYLLACYLIVRTEGELAISVDPDQNPHIVPALDSSGAVGFANARKHYQDGSRHISYRPSGAVAGATRTIALPSPVTPWAFIEGKVLLLRQSMAGVTLSLVPSEAAGEVIWSISTPVFPRNIYVDEQIIAFNTTPNQASPDPDKDPWDVLNLHPAGGVVHATPGPEFMRGLLRLKDQGIAIGGRTVYSEDNNWPWEISEAMIVADFCRDATAAASIQKPRLIGAVTDGRLIAGYSLSRSKSDSTLAAPFTTQTITYWMDELMLYDVRELDRSTDAPVRIPWRLRWFETERWIPTLTLGGGFLFAWADGRVAAWDVRNPAQPYFLGLTRCPADMEYSLVSFPTKSHFNNILGVCGPIYARELPDGAIELVDTLYGRIRLEFPKRMKGRAAS